MPFAPKSKGASIRVRSSSSSKEDADVKKASGKMAGLRIRSTSKKAAVNDSSDDENIVSDDEDDDEVTEEYLREKKRISPNDILRLHKPCKKYLCKPSANTYAIDFVSFKIRDMDHGGRTLFEVKKPAGAKFVPTKDGDDSGRFVQYDFGAPFLDLETVGTTVTFTVGSKPVEGFRMIERHYFKDELLKSFDFDFGFCVPNSRNSCEQIYALPDLSKKEKQKMIQSPYKTRSDSFYFVKNKLVMHNKAEYAYQER